MDSEISVLPVRAYFDMHVWVDLAEGLRGHPGRWEPVLVELLEHIATGRLVTPLSASHYLELWHRRDHDSRKHTASVMRDLSQYRAIAPIQRIQRLEADAAVAATLGLAPRSHLADCLFGFGVNHAFDSPYGRFRFVDSLETETDAEGPPSSPPDVDLRTLEGSHWEWNSLFGPPSLIDLELDRTPEYRHGTRFAAQELRIRSWLKDNPTTPDSLYDVVVLEEINACMDVIGEAAADYGVPSLQLFMEHPIYERPPDAIRAFAESMPSLHVLATLRAWKHRDVQHPWEQHDKVDLMSLSLAIPYHDVVITEKRWVHLANASGLAKTYRTRLLGGHRALDSLLDLLRSDDR